MAISELPESPTVPAFDWSAAFAGRVTDLRPSEIRGFLRLLANPEIVSFAGGIPEPALFPYAAIERAMHAIMADPARRALAFQYSASEGYQPLREWVARYMARRGVTCTADNIVITVGSQEALDLTAKLLIDRGDRVLTTAPAYLGAIQALSFYGPRWDVIDLAGPHARQRWDGAKLAYLVPEFSNPGTETMPLDDRLRLLELARESGTPVVEDAAYEALRYEGSPQPSLQSLDIETAGDIDASLVIYTGTFSKTVAPGLRVGWICAAAPLVQRIVLARQAADLHGSVLDQMIIHEVVATGFDAQVQSLLPVYRARRDAMLAALAETMPKGVTWTRPEGGMFVWLTLPEGLDSRVLLQDSLTTEGIIFVPGTSFFPDGAGEEHIRLNFTRSDEATITEGIARLARLISRHLTR